VGDREILETYSDSASKNTSETDIYPHGPKSLLISVINYGIIIKSISTLMYTVWHVDKYKITFKLVINHWTNKIL